LLIASTLRESRDKQRICSFSCSLTCAIATVSRALLGHCRVQPTDVNERLEKEVQVIILSQGMWKMLQVTPKLTCLTDSPILRHCSKMFPIGDQLLTLNSPVIIRVPFLRREGYYTRLLRAIVKKVTKDSINFS